jgi:hypothetical protein
MRTCSSPGSPHCCEPQAAYPETRTAHHLRHRCPNRGRRARSGRAPSPGRPGSSHLVLTGVPPSRGDPVRAGPAWHRELLVPRAGTVTTGAKKPHVNTPSRPDLRCWSMMQAASNSPTCRLPRAGGSCQRGRRPRDGPHPGGRNRRRSSSGQVMILPDLALQAEVVSSSPIISPRTAQVSIHEQRGGLDRWLRAPGSCH